MILIDDYAEYSTEKLLEMRKAIQNQLKENERNPQKVALRKLYMALQQVEEAFGDCFILFEGEGEDGEYFQLEVSQCRESLKDNFIF